MFARYTSQWWEHCLTLSLLTWTIWRAPTNASKWRMGFNSAFKRFKEVVLMTSRLNIIWLIYNLKITIVSHDIRQKTINMLPSWSRFEKPIYKCTVCTACLCSVTQNDSQLYIKSSNISKVFFEGTGTAVITLHNKSTFISFAHRPAIKHCVYRMGEIGKFSFWM